MVVNAIQAGKGEAIHFETSESVEKGDWILVCSDGVSDVVTVEEIQEILARPEVKVPADANRILSKLLVERWRQGGEAYKLDNATAVFMRA